MPFETAINAVSLKIIQPRGMICFAITRKMSNFAA